MTISCPNCGRPTTAGTRFCGGCGSSLAAPAPLAGAPAAAPSATPYAAPAYPPPAGTDEKGFSCGRMLKFGWRTTWDNFGSVVGVFTLAIVLYVVVALAPLLLTATLPDSTAIVVLLLWSLVLIVAPAILMLGLCRVALRWADDERGAVADLFSDFPRLLSFIGAFILYYFIVLGGLLLFVIPGIVWAMTFSMFPFLILDKRLGPVEALKASARVTSGAKWDLFALSVILQYVVTAGLYAFGIGVFVTAPVAALGWARAYRWLEQRTAAA